MSNPTSDRFREKARGRQRSAWVEFADFVLHNKKWWLTPVLVVIALFGTFVVLSGTGVAPFIYSLF